MEREVMDACRALALSGPLDHGWLDAFFAENEDNVYYRLCYWLVRSLMVDVAVELGTCEGRCAAHMAGARDGVTVHAVDIGRHGAFDAHTSWLDNVMFHRAGSTDPAVLEQVGDGTVGLCLVDTVPAWDHALAEVAAWTPKMKSSGIFLLDDLDWDDGMRGLLDKLPFGRKGRMDDMHPGHGFGWAMVG